eukprot:CAMPEP_0170537546 /NCGR_PEP_ID=MMETSP0209-20121228/102778_1 /TAXON_ID=665100 ORGANISM="Litonotus pictus, Strain P1" /NCGR_SAMPLE_ID=MMETSP0209 /ASSEMBLY_ACC=CAM_ASM_000301 /LENGTH=347 /DNA_ID=CAMNT_0010839065 /DNA_START=4933 /DNA_END=5976 /DNA_ORIENTATION=+
MNQTEKKLTKVFSTNLLLKKHSFFSLLSSIKYSNEEFLDLELDPINQEEVVSYTNDTIKINDQRKGRSYNIQVKVNKKRTDDNIKDMTDLDFFTKYAKRDDKSQRREKKIGKLYDSIVKSMLDNTRSKFNNSNINANDSILIEVVKKPNEETGKRKKYVTSLYPVDRRVNFKDGNSHSNSKSKSKGKGIGKIPGMLIEEEGLISHRNFVDHNKSISMVSSKYDDTRMTYHPGMNLDFKVLKGTDTEDQDRDIVKEEDIVPVRNTYINNYNTMSVFKVQDDKEEEANDKAKGGSVKEKENEIRLVNKKSLGQFRNRIKRKVVDSENEVIHYRDFKERDIFKDVNKGYK